MAKPATETPAIEAAAWKAKGFQSYEESVHPALAAILKTLGGNSSYAELAVAETVREMMKRCEDLEALVSLFRIGGDLRIMVQTDHGEFPSIEWKSHVQFYAKTTHAESVWAALAERFLEKRTIWRILSPAECVIMDAEGKKVTLLFRVPFVKQGAKTVAHLARKLYIERDEVIS